MTDSQRRQFLVGVGGLGAATLAGCSGILGDGSGNSGGSIPAYADWVPATVRTENWEYGVSAVDVDRFKRELPAARSSRFRSDVSSFAQALGVEESRFDTVVQIEEAEQPTHTIITGSFDVDAIQSRLESSFENEAYRGYRVLGIRLAISQDAIVSSTSFEDVIDAKEGVVDRIYERPNAWSDALRDAGTATLSSVSRHSGEPYQLLATAITSPDGDALDVVGHAHFPDAEAANTYSAEVGPAMEEHGEDVGPLEIRTVQTNGAVVRVEARATSYDF
ncbi:hypothetical protein L593_03145 [Salinarchaeum sp. Harcht-Bsk1]|uniref:hypothetical protein n=1 Tax=Salinarchaeum sp. Harcht-Bsk1 TaxID=1333523 RepID=UPI0003422933|nr:hypothetical protein [Salinarchaeum sp. Harcht-Bsk1]AGN00580.1 hypothetical protein L593_03145 [Salinarchaeum sp. Harcht-Bsk1]